MKKILFVIYFFSIAAIGQQTDASLTTQTNVIRNESTPGGNTKGRVADMYQSIIDSKLSILKNLSDLDNKPTARTNLGLGTLATQNGTFTNKQDLLVSGTNIKTINGNTLLGSGDLGITSGTVTTFSAGTLSPLFTTSISNATTTPALSFNLTNSAANSVFGNFTSSSGAPSYNSSSTNGQFLVQRSGALTFGTLVSGDIPDISATYQPILSGTGFIKATGSTISYDNSTYLTGNQSITLTPTGDVTGSASGTTTLTPTFSIGAGKVTNSMLAGSIDLTTKVTGLLPDANISSATTWNSKESALTFSSPLSRSTNTISIPSADGLTNGYLSSTDWTTFNNKQTAITFGTGSQTALGINVGSSGAFVVNGGALGTPSSGVATNLTGTASSLTAGNVTTNANLTGDVTSVGNSTTLATVNSNTGSFGSATQAGTFTVNGKGLITAASNTTITPAVGSITGLGTGVSTWLATPSWTNFNSAITGTSPYWPLTGSATLNTPILTGIPTIVGNIVAQTDNLGITQVSNSGVVLNNTQAATSGNQQISPAIRWQGNGWKTTATAASQTVEFIADVLPVQGTTAPTGTWRLGPKINGGVLGSTLTYTSTGSLTVPGFVTITNASSSGQTLFTINKSSLSFGIEQEGRTRWVAGASYQNVGFLDVSGTMVFSPSGASHGSIIKLTPNVTSTSNTSTDYISGIRLNPVWALGTTSPLVVGWDYDPTFTGTAPTGRYGVLIRSALDLSGFGTASPISNIDIAGSLGMAIATVTTNTTLDATYHTILCDATGGNITITLPSAAAATRREYIIKKIDASANTVAFSADGGTVTLSAQYAGKQIQSNGTSYYVTGSF